MSPVAPQHRATRGRVVAVPRAPIFDESLTAPADGVIHVQTLFQAVGEVARSSARAPVEAVLIHAPLANRPLDLVLNSIQRLDPSVMVFMVVEPHDVASAEQARQTGFDGVLKAPVSAAALDAALVGEVSPFGDDAEDDERVESGRPIVISHQPSVIGHQPDEAPSADELDSPSERLKAGGSLSPVDVGGDDHGDDADREVSPAAAASTGTDRPVAASEPMQPEAVSRPPTDAGQQPLATAAAMPGHAVRLGDVDVVEAILRDPDAAVETAIRLIQQETGWSEVHLLPSDEPHGASAGVPQRSVNEMPGDCRAEVRFGTDDHGVLSSPGADSAALAAWAAWLARWLSLARAHRSLRALAYTDPLTGAWNRRFFDEFMPQALEHARARRRSLVVMVFDVDDLKTFNDRHGHDAGDRVLRECVRLLQSVIRKGDRVCRIGGDEFAVVFADDGPPRRAGSAPVESVEVIARRFQDAICAARLPALGTAGAAVRLSVSAGLATFPWDATDAQSLLRVADLRALESKQRGKNALTFGPCHEPDQHDPGALSRP